MNFEQVVATYLYQANTPIDIIYGFFEYKQYGVIQYVLSKFEENVSLGDALLIIQEMDNVYNGLLRLHYFYEDSQNWIEELTSENSSTSIYG